MKALAAQPPRAQWPGAAHAPRGGGAPQPPHRRHAPLSATPRQGHRPRCAGRRRRRRLTLQYSPPKSRQPLAAAGHPRVSAVPPLCQHHQHIVGAVVGTAVRNVPPQHPPRRTKTRRPIPSPPVLSQRLGSAPARDPWQTGPPAPVQRLCHRRRVAATTRRRRHASGRRQRAQPRPRHGVRDCTAHRAGSAPAAGSRRCPGGVARMPAHRQPGAQQAVRAGAGRPVQALRRALLHAILSGNCIGCQKYFPQHIPRNCRIASATSASCNVVEMAWPWVGKHATNALL